MTDNQYKSLNQPDVLEVIANLSNNEVFTPPRVVNNVLDLLPENVWKDPSLRWLDPGAKTGVFPREITKRLLVGLADAIPDESKRLQHILGEMVFAFAITDMTAMMTRRSLYCSKDASSEKAASPLPTPGGNVWHERIEHSYDAKGRCIECDGNKAQLEQQGRDNYAYGFIHEEGRQQISKETNMQFDVIVGNPPYQSSGGGGGTNDTPIYDVFVEEAIKLNPKYISMIIPSRWMAGGRGLEAFRASMLADRRIRQLFDYTNADELFPGIDLEGGVCYFLWDRDNVGACATRTHRGNEVSGPVDRDLNQFDIFVRDARGLPVLQKVLERGEASFANLVSGDTPFGLASNFKGYRKSDKKQSGDLKLLMNEGGQRVEHWVDQTLVSKNVPLIKVWKVLVPKARGTQVAPDVVLGTPIVAAPSSVCSQTYLVIGPLGSKAEAESLDSYLRTRFVRYLVSLRKISQDAMKSVYTWVPQQAWDRTWTDAELYKKYGITKDEQAYIATMIKEMPA